MGRYGKHRYGCVGLCCCDTHKCLCQRQAPSWMDASVLWSILHKARGRNKRPSPFLKCLPLRYPFPLGGHWRNGYEPAIRILLQDIAFFFFFCVVVGGGVCRRDRRKTLQNVGSSGQHTHTQPNQQQQRNPFFLVVIEQPMCFDQGHHF